MLNIYYNKQDREIAVAKAETLCNKLFPENDTESRKENHKKFMRMGGDAMAMTINIFERQPAKKEVSTQES